MFSLHAANPCAQRRIKLVSSDGFVSGTFVASNLEPIAPLLVCIHGGGCNSNYFDLSGCSMAEAAIGRGFDLLLVDRPGHAGNPPLAVDRPVAASAPLIRRFVDDARERVGAGDEIVILGHSIGAAIALHMASERGDWPLRAVAVSGIGDQPAEAIRGIRLPRGQGRVEPPPALTEALFHAGSHPQNWRAIASLRRAAEQWLVAEVEDVMNTWPREWPSIAARIDVPVQVRLAEHEQVWTASPEVIDRMRRALSNTRVDAALLASGGHLYEVSRAGPELLRQQLDFLEACLGRDPDRAHAR